MANVNLSNLARMTVSSSGTGTITLNAAVAGFLTFDLSGLSTAAAGSVVRYAINDTAASEIAYGTYTSSAISLTRGSSTTGMKSTNNNSPINMSNAAQVFITEAAADFPFIIDTGGATGTTTLALSVPTAAVDTNTAQVANTAFVVAQAGASAPIVDGAATVGVSLRFSRQDHIHPTDTSRAPVASPTFTGVPAAPTAAPATNTTQIATTAFVLANAPSYSFPSGTLMLFQQTAAPTGWTKQVTHNDKALRVVSGAASSGGSSPFSTVFSITATNSYTLLTADIPSHAHPNDPSVMIGNQFSSALNQGITGGSAYNVVGEVADASPGAPNTGLAGGGGGHSHGINLQVAYVDLIIAAKD